MNKESINKIGAALIEKYGMQDGVDLFVDLVAELQESAIMIRLLEEEKDKEKDKEEKEEKGDKKEESPSVVPDVPLTTPGYPYPYVNPIWGGSGTGEHLTWDWDKVTCDGSEAPKVYYGDYKNKTGGASIASTSAETATSSQTKMVKIMDSAGRVFEVPESSFGIYAENQKARDEQDERAPKPEIDGRGSKKSPKKD